MLTVFGGLPGTGKTTIARELARQLGAVYLRVDSIEQALRDYRAGRHFLDDAGYRVAYLVAADNLSNIAHLAGDYFSRISSWDRSHLVVDTARQSVEPAVQTLPEAIAAQRE